MRVRDWGGARQSHCIAPHAVHSVHRLSQTLHQIFLAIELVSSRRAGHVMSRLEAIAHTNGQIMSLNGAIPTIAPKQAPRMELKRRGTWKRRINRSRSMLTSRPDRQLSKLWENSSDRTVCLFIRVNTGTTQPATCECAYLFPTYTLRNNRLRAYNQLGRTIAIYLSLVHRTSPPRIYLMLLEPQ